MGADRRPFYQPPEGLLFLEDDRDSTCSPGLIHHTLLYRIQDSTSEISQS